MQDTFQDWKTDTNISYFESSQAKPSLFFQKDFCLPFITLPSILQHTLTRVGSPKLATREARGTERPIHLNTSKLVKKKYKGLSSYHLKFYNYDQIWSSKLKVISQMKTHQQASIHLTWNSHSNTNREDDPSSWDLEGSCVLNSQLTQDIGRDSLCLTENKTSCYNKHNRSRTELWFSGGVFVLLFFGTGQGERV